MQFFVEKTRPVKNEVIDKVKLCPNDILNRNFIIYGGSGSGKTTFLKYLLSIIARDIMSAIVFCPTDQSTGVYSNLVPEQLIHHQFNLGILKNAYDGQKQKMEVYRQSCDIEKLEKIYGQIRTSETDHVIETLHRICDQSIGQIKANHSSNAIRMNELIDQAKSRNKEALVNYYRTVINDKHSDVARKCSNIPDIEAIIYGCSYKPNLIVIMDDCASSFKSLSKEEKAILTSIYFEGRHYGLTTFLITQDDGIIDKNIRDNAHIWAFTSSKALGAAVGRIGAYTSLIKKFGQVISAGWNDKGLDDDDGRVVVLYSTVHTQEMVYLTYNQASSFKILPQPIWDFCRQIAKPKDRISENNEFANRLSKKKS